MNDEVEIGLINKEQKKVIGELEEVLSFLKSAQIKDEAVLVHIKKPLDDLRSSVKYIPTEPYFGIIPTEIKTKILSYLCDSKAFTTASVCVEWKGILKSRFTGKSVTIGKPCCRCECKDIMCLNSSINLEMLKAAATHKLDVHLFIDHSVREVDSKLVTDALTSVSRFSIIGECNFDYDCHINPLSIDQLEDLFKGLENKMETMEQVQLEWLDLEEVNQDRLANCFVNKIKKLILGDCRCVGRMFNIETFINKLSQQSAEFKLNQLILDVEYPEELAIELANALCNVENVKLFNAKVESVTQLIENIVTDERPVMIKTLIVYKSIDFRTLISPEDLQRLCNKMLALRLDGHFTVEQLEAVRSLPDVEVSGILSAVIRKY